MNSERERGVGGGKNDGWNEESEQQLRKYLNIEKSSHFLCLPHLKVCECYMKLNDWKEASEWHLHVTSLRDQHQYTDVSHAYSLDYDLNKIQ